jgi:hypothetical protein
MMKKIQKLVLTAILFSVFVGAGESIAGEKQEQSLNHARELFYKSIEHKDSIPEAIELFEKLKDNEALAGRATTYLGALTALKARFAFWPQKKLSLANKGLAMMDEGILASPHDVEALFVHGSTCYYLPFFFGRKDDAIRSLKRIVELLPEQMHRYDPELTDNVINFIKENVELEPVEIEKLESIQVLLALG